MRLLLVIGSLYLVTNIGFSFFFFALGTILLEGGVSTGTVALINLLGIAYFGRMLIGPVVDRFATYRTWLITTQVVLVAVLLALTPLDPVADLPVTVTLMVVVLVVSAFHDTALGGLAVRLLPPTARGLANGIQMASASASIMIGSSGALLLYARAGWAVTVLVLAGVFVVPLIVLTRLHEPPGTRAERAGPTWPVLVGFFRRPRMAMWALVIIPFFYLGDWLATATQPAMLLAAHWPLEDIALAQSLALVAQIVAALVTGVAVTRFGHVWSALLIGILGIVALAGLVPLATGRGAVGFTVAAMVLLSVVFGARLTWIATVTMDLARSSSAATDYAVPMSVDGICVTLAGSAGLALAGGVGFVWLMVIAIVFAVASTPFTTRWIHRTLDLKPT
ncbi:MFS transporter [Pseudonocardia spinosispora]|uniref:MFS transporter n=1 Tax=Pseudonocardia spinosispora TaxID=103441 RepID=UPI0003F8060B|nr:MFS transporter [Pseudonocardia spinosispora]